MSFTANIDEIVADNHNRLLGIRPGWKRVRLREVATILNGYPFESAKFKQDRGTPLLRIRDVVRGQTDTFYDDTFDPAFLVQAGELVVGMDGDFNSARWRGEPALLNQRVCKITVDQLRYSPRFLEYVLPGYLAAINAHTPSVTVKHLSSRTVGDIPLPFPSLDEQQRIVAEIEKQFTRLNAGVASLKRVQTGLKRYRASVLKAACEGRLVPTEAELARKENRSYETGEQLLQRILKERGEKWNGKGKYKEPAIPDSKNVLPLRSGWTLSSLEQLTNANRPICYGILMPKDNVPNGVLYVKVRDMKGDRIATDSLHRTTTQIAAKYARASLQTGDLLLAIRGTYGRVAETPPALNGGNITQDTARLDVTPLIDHRYVAICLRSPHCQNYLKGVARGVAVKGVNIADVKTTPIA
ncbi:MAG: restriction endonuclease subunit S, partial [Verrucomicrobia bacterium]|nr:restriction endonuclease subunit S [Verrucomicrobiota bacterium]